MKKKLTMPLLLLASLGLAYIITSLVLSHLLSEERLRLMLVDPLESQLDRKIDIGSIHVSLLSGINIADINIHGKNPGEEFLSIAAFRLTYRFLPLFEKKLVLSEILIDHPSLKLSRDAKGIYNFADLSLKPRKIEKENLPPDEQTVDPLPLTLVFDKITVNNANLTFTDQTGELPEITSSKGDLDLALTLADNLAESTYQGKLNLIVNTDYNAHKPVLIVNCSIDEQQIAFKGELSVEFEKLLFNGQATNLFVSPDLNLNLQSTSLDIGKLLSLNPAAADPTSQPPSPSAAEAGTEPDTTTPKAGSTLSAHGQINIINLQYDKITLQKFNLAYTFKDKHLALKELTCEAFGGKVAGQLLAALNGTSPVFQGQVEVSKLHVADLMGSLGKPAGFLSGDLSATLALQGEGKDWPEIRPTLAGDGRFSLVQGGLAGSPYTQALATLLDLPGLNDLKFEELAGTLKISEGQMAVLATMSSPELDLQTKGSAGLDGRLDFPLTLQLSQENSRRLLEKSQYAGYLADDSGRTTLNLKMTGTLSQPVLALDGSSTGQQVRKVLEKKAGEELNRAITKQLRSPGEEQKKDVVEDLSNRFLKQLLDN